MMLCNTFYILFKGSNTKNGQFCPSPQTCCDSKYNHHKINSQHFAISPDVSHGFQMCQLTAVNLVLYSDVMVIYGGQL